MKFSSLIASVIFAAVMLVGCGQQVEVPPASVGKIMGSEGYKEGIIATSKFRLPKCWSACDKLVILDVSDRAITENMELFMPKDKLIMTFDVRTVLTVKPNAYEELFNKIPPVSNGDDSLIPLERAYQTYAQQIIRTEARAFMSQFTIAEVSSSLDAVNAKLSERLSTVINSKTPFIVRSSGLGSVRYPDIITRAQENAAERREKIQGEEAQLQISKVQLERKLQETQLQRKVDVEKAQAESQVNKILADSITPEYVRYRSLEVMDKLADSDNKVFIPAAMLDSIATQTMVGRQ